MLGLTGVASDNIIERYKARFRTEEHTQGMLYQANENAIPARLSTEQYNSYITEFEQFIRTSKRRLLLSALLLILFTFVLAVVAVVYLDINLLEKYEAPATAAFMVCWMLPLVFIFRDGKRLYDKPTRELQVLPEGVVQPLSNREKMDRRIMGMSYSMLTLLGLIPVLAIVVTLLEGIPNERELTSILLYCMMLASAIYLWIRKSRAHQEDAKRHEKK